MQRRSGQHEEERDRSPVEHGFRTRRRTLPVEAAVNDGGASILHIGISAGHQMRNRKDFSAAASRLSGRLRGRYAGSFREFFY